MSDTVWIAFLDNGSEGKSEPLCAFDSEFLASMWLRGSEDTYGSGGTVKALPVLSVSKAIRPDTTETPT